MFSNRRAKRRLDIKEVTLSNETLKLVEEMQALIPRKLNKVASSSSRSTKTSAKFHTFNDPLLNKLSQDAFYASSARDERSSKSNDEVSDKAKIKKLLDKLSAKTSRPDCAYYITIEMSNHLDKLKSLAPSLIKLDEVARNVICSMNSDIVIQLANKEIDRLAIIDDEGEISNNIKRALAILVETTKDKNIDPKCLQNVLAQLQELSHDLSKVQTPEQQQAISKSFSSFVSRQKCQMIGQQLLFALKAIAAALIAVATLGFNRGYSSQLLSSGRAYAKFHRDLTNSLHVHNPITHAGIKKRGRQ